MDIQPLFDQVAKAIAFIDETDVASLQELRMQLVELKEASERDGLDGVSTACDRGMSAIDALIWATEGVGGDTDEWLKLLNSIASYASQVLDALELKQSVDSIQIPEISTASVAPARTHSAQPIDPELLAMFVSSSSDNLAELEESLLELESGSGDNNPAECFAQIKRSLHSIKGECGVVPLPQAQALCHAAEDLFDRFSELNVAIPISLLLEVSDCLSHYCYQLADGVFGEVPGLKELLARLKATQPDPALASMLADGVEELPDSLLDDHELIEKKLSESPLLDDVRIAFPAEVLADEVVPDFISEAREHIESSEAALLELEHEPENGELINAIFRAFHTIKGVAGYLNLEPMVELAHTAETLMDQLRKGEAKCDKVHLDLIFSSCDVMSALVGALEGREGPSVSAHRRLVEALKAEISGSSQPEVEQPESVDVGIVCGEKPTNKRRLLEILISEGMITEKMSEVLIERQRNMKTAKLIGQIAIDTGLVTQANIDAALEIQARESAGQPAPRETQSAEQLSPQAVPQAALVPRKPRVASTIKVNTGRLDSLVDLVGELVIAQQMVYQDPALETLGSERLARNLSQVAKITRDMHEAAMSLRMVTLRPTFQKMARLVRDVSAKAGKEVELVLAGEDTELDRNVVEEISDPMVHLIRNAIDHGLETPDVRKAKGKPPCGRVELRASHQGGAIVIEIVDDGAGLSRDQILAKAIEKGVLPNDQAPNEMSDSQVWDLIFQPGFSTAAVVSDISGRGVGMDVVRRNIEKMRGKVEITSKFGQGSVFSLRLPLTLAIIDGMIVRVGSQRYVLPTLSIEQSFRPQADQLHGVMNEAEMVEVRDMLLPIHRLREIFDQADGVTDAMEGILILLEDNGARCCLMVDEILGQQQVVIKSLGQAGSVLRGISGGAILGDGRIALIVDVDGVVTRTSKVAA